jgi:hypothetical protein
VDSALVAVVDAALVAVVDSALVAVVDSALVAVVDAALVAVVDSALVTVVLSGEVAVVLASVRDFSINTYAGCFLLCFMCHFRNTITLAIADIKTIIKDFKNGCFTMYNISTYYQIKNLYLCLKHSALKVSVSLK